MTQADGKPRESASAILVGLGRGGCAIAEAAKKRCGRDMRVLLADTDARTGMAHPGEPFLLLGGTRLGGAGSGRDIPNARAAASESMRDFDERVGNARLAVVVAGLGGGTGGGAAIEALEHFRRRGTVTFVFATLPFAFEGPEAARLARNARPLVEKYSDACTFQPLDVLVCGAGPDNMREAFERGMDAAAEGIAFFWRLLETPGYISLDLERIRRTFQDAGPATLLVAGASGPSRARSALSAMLDSPLLGGDGKIPEARKLVVGVLGGDDLRLSETGTVADGLAAAFGKPEDFSLGTVNDDEAFSGRLVAVAFAFTSAPPAPRQTRRRAGKAAADPLGGTSASFGDAKNFWKGEDLDTPAYLRRNLELER